MPEFPRAHNMFPHTHCNKMCLHRGILTHYYAAKRRNVTALRLTVLNAHTDTQLSQRAQHLNLHRKKIAMWLLPHYKSKGTILSQYQCITSFGKCTELISELKFRNGTWLWTLDCSCILIAVLHNKTQKS